MRDDMKLAQQSSLKKSENAIVTAMSNVYFLAKQNLPSSLLQTMNRFLLYQGVEQLNDLKVDEHTNYEHSSSVSDFQESISSVIEDSILEKVKDSEKFSLMFDESTDISIHQNLIMYIRILETSMLGVTEPHTYFLSIDSLARANAESIYLKVCNTLCKKGIRLSGLCSVSTDGASVMVGCKSGVVTRLKEEVPGVLATHCIAHRLALSCCSAADSIPYLVKVQEILNNSYKYFHNSPKNMAMLEGIQSCSGKSSKFKEVFHTRWLSFEGSVDAMVSNYSSLVSVFLEEKSGKALSLHKPITSYKFLHVIHFLADILKPLSNLSKSYQQADLDFSEVTSLLLSTTESINKLEYGKFGSKLQGFLSKVPSEPKVDSDGLLTFLYEGHTIRDGAKQREEAINICSSFASKIVSSLKDRFTDNKDSTILTAMSNFFNPTLGANSKLDDLEIIEEYLFKLGFEGCRDELELFLGFLDSLVQSGNKSVVRAKDVASLAIRKKDVYPATGEVACRFLIAPVSTVDCERGFSRQNLIKTCLRNSMGIETLDRLMRISIDGPDLKDFPFSKAFSKWTAAKSRRILT